MTRIADTLVTRFEVINQTGRLLVLMDVSNVRVVLQDDGRTMKVFLDDNNNSEVNV